MSIKRTNFTAIPGVPHHEPLTTRRDFLLRGGAGFGAIALAGLLQEDAAAANAANAADAEDWRCFPARAKNVIFLFMEGGPSHLDLFDPKPLLNKLAGQPIPPSFGKVVTAMGEEESPLLGCKRKWQQYGEGGIWVSDWLPHIATCADDLAVIRSCVADGINHSSGVCQMNTGHLIGGRPSLGAWVTYGLGTENRDMPGFVVLKDNQKQTTNGPRNWGSGFMPASYQGIALQPGAEPIPNLRTPESVGDARQAGKLAFLAQLNRRHAAARAGQSELDARIRGYELAFRMQASAPEAIDLTAEPAHIQSLYGMDAPETMTFGRNCLLARRLVERGVRFIQLYSGTGSEWDAHAGIEANHGRLCRATDKPIAGLLKDLKQRGLLEETLVLWGGEFGRTPMSEKGDGRDHNPTGFTMWMAGGGVRGGRTYGSTDALGLHAVENRLHVHDLHATVMRILGIDHTRLIFRHKGRPERVDLNEGTACEQLLA